MGQDLITGRGAGRRCALLAFTRKPGRGLLFLGGDLNTRPNEWSLDPLWQGGYGRRANGSLIEVDSGPSQENPRYQRHSGEYTHGGILTREKIDYIFVHGVAVTRGEVGSSKLSDHRPLWATVVQPALQPGDSGW